MILQHYALIAAGIIGVIISIAHGLIVQKKMIKPVIDSGVLKGAFIRLYPILMQFSTICWLLGGVMLMAAPFVFDATETKVLALFISVFYAIGAIGNFYGTKGKHPGWVLLAVAVSLIVYAVV